MTETIHDGKWHWYSIEDDLRKQGCEVTIDPLSVNENFCNGYHSGSCISVSWVPDFCLLVTMQQFSQKLIDAFSQIIEYQPSCKYKYKYRHSGKETTVEWHRRGLGGDQLRVLRKNEKISDIVLL